MRILIVEDEVRLARQIQAALKEEGYTADPAFDGPSGLERALLEEYDLIILDLMLPELSGLEILQELRRQKMDTPVLILTVKNRIEDKVAGLDAGADDYLTKPFATAELLARIRSLLRRHSGTKYPLLEIADVRVNPSTREVFRGGRAVSLTAKEYAILEFLLYNKNRVVSRLSIAEHVWGDHFDPFTMTNFVDVHIKNLRKKLADDRDKKLIRTVRGVGYLIKDPL